MITNQVMVFSCVVGSLPHWDASTMPMEPFGGRVRPEPAMVDFGEHLGFRCNPRKDEEILGSIGHRS